jgi:ADP-ribose pyrophosphatase YjhB (NUDIX family)
MLTTKKSESEFVCENGHSNWVDATPTGVTYVIKDGKLLFGVRTSEVHGGGFNIPGGFLNPGENAEQAAVRETKEELGIEVAIIDFLGTYLCDYDGKPVLNIVFIAEYVSGDVMAGDDMGGGKPVLRAIDDLPIKEDLAWDWQLAAQTDLAKWWKVAGPA